MISKIAALLILQLVLYTHKITYHGSFWLVDTCSAYQKLENIESDNIFLEFAGTVHSFQWPIRDLEKIVSKVN